MPGKFSSNRRGLRRNHVAVALVALIAISALVRLLVVLTFRARASWDTDGYILAARSIASLDFSRYDGKRTPIYPLLMFSPEWTGTWCDGFSRCSESESHR